MDQFFSQSKISGMCRERAKAHVVLANTKWSSRYHQWHLDLGSAYEKLALVSIRDKNEALQKMAMLDECVIQALSLDVPFEHCIELGK